MKHILISSAIVLSLFTACNNTDTKTPVITDSSGHAAADTSKMSSTTAMDTHNKVSVKDIVNSYLQLKNALTKDNDKDAASAGNSIVTAFANFQPSSLTAEQSKLYTDIQDDAKEHAEHIGKNAGNIKHQREHFDMLSKDIYQLVKTFGAGQNLYYDHCPMYNDGKGADWLSENKSISNPYLGKAMPTCGSVKEELK